MLNTEYCKECDWYCSDIPGVFNCNKCIKVKHWDRFAQAFEYFKRHPLSDE